MSGVRQAAGALAAAALFAGLAAAVASGRTQRTDDALRRRQRHPRRGAARNAALVVKVVGAPNVQVPVAAAIALSLGDAGAPNAASVLAATGSVYVLDKACKVLIHRHRPPGYVGNETLESFPSGHTAAVSALGITLAQIMERAGMVRPPLATLAAVILTLGVAESRLLLDEHWPTDVLGGALLGTAIALTVLSVAD